MERSANSGLCLTRSRRFQCAELWRRLQTRCVDWVLSRASQMRLQDMVSRIVPARQKPSRVPVPRPVIREFEIALAKERSNSTHESGHLFHRENFIPNPHKKGFS